MLRDFGLRVEGLGGGGLRGWGLPGRFFDGASRFSGATTCPLCPPVQRELAVEGLGVRIKWSGADLGHVQLEVAIQGLRLFWFWISGSRFRFTGFEDLGFKVEGNRSGQRPWEGSS